MSNIRIISNTIIRFVLKSKEAYISIVSMIILFVPVGVLIVCLLAISPAMEAEFPDKSFLEFTLGLIIYSVFLLGAGIYADILSITLLKDKAGNLESLLCTPVKLREIWLSNSIAFFLPGIVMGLILTLLTLIIINCIYFIPKIGFFFTPWITVNSFIVVPVLYLSFSLLIPLVGMNCNPILGVITAYMAASGIMPLTLNLAIHMRNRIDITSWSFTLLHFGIVILICIIVLFLFSRLTKERIVLSRKR